MTLIRLSETDSTINYLRRVSESMDTEEFTTVISAFQTQGRGQRSNSWESEKGKNLLFSFILYPAFLRANTQFILSQVTALSIKEELSNHTEGVSIKWPNDIYWRDKKICGILIENDLTGNAISSSIHGAGINLNQTSFSAMPLNPVSLKSITGVEYDPEEVLLSIMERIEHYYDRIRKGDQQEVVSRYLDSLYRRDGIHEYEDKEGRFKASFHSISALGNLILKDSSGELRSYAFKEVRFVL